jgi:Asparagine synthase
VKINLDFSYFSKATFDIRQNGIQLIETEESINIYTDPFRTVPVFITTLMDGTVFLFSDFSKVYKLDGVNKTVDPAGFWEIILFGTGLWTRTLYQNIKQMPSAAKLTIDRATGKYSISRYWDYNVELDPTLTSSAQVSDGLLAALDLAFADLQPSNSYLSGLSGGLDSRVNVAMLSRHVSKEKIKSFTFGFDPNILEHKFAISIAKELDLAKPDFFRLNPINYQNALNYLPKNSGGQISINHSHILEYLNQNKEDYDDVLFVSTYFTDALFGYACPERKNIDTPQDCGYFKRLNSSTFIAKEIKDLIADDINDLLAEYNNSGSNYGNVNEYAYIIERNHKFHMYLGFLQGQILTTQPIYANYDLLCYCLSIPIELRFGKRIIDRLLERHFPSIRLDRLDSISSRSFSAGISSAPGKYRLQKTANYLSFRGRNIANSFLRQYISPRYQLFNKYQTEEQEKNLRTEFKKQLESATSKLLSLGLFDLNVKCFYDKIPIKSSSISESYIIISLAQIL